MRLFLISILALLPFKTMADGTHYFLNPPVFNQENKQENKKKNQDNLNFYYNPKFFKDKEDTIQPLVDSPYHSPLFPQEPKVMKTEDKSLLLNF